MYILIPVITMQRENKQTVMLQQIVQIVFQQRQRLKYDILTGFASFLHSIKGKVMKLHRWKAYPANGCWRVFTSQAYAKKYAGEDGFVVDLYATKLA